MDKSRWKKMEDLYESALQLPETERARFLDANCAEDASMRDELDSLLSSSGESDGFLSEGGFELGIQLLGSPGRVFQSGQDFGRFKIIDLLGRGGMGEVYLAEDSRLGRSVALKILPNAIADDEGVRRLLQEARTASALNHPNILTIYDVGEIEGRNFISLEFIKGRTLREILKRSAPLRVPEACKINTQISAALSAAHSSGIVHRDIKPENVMIRDDGLVKVLDFGLAKLIPGGIEKLAKEDQVVTNRGMIFGTVTYMSPEQVRGKETDSRSDIWSLGVVLFEMLTGSHPFDGETVSDKIAAILKTEPDLRPMNIPGLPDAARNIVLKALEKSPGERYQDVNELSRDLVRAFESDYAELRTTHSLDTEYRAVTDTTRSTAHNSTGRINAGFWRGRRIGVTVTAFAAAAAIFAVWALWRFLPVAPGTGSPRVHRVVSSGKSFAAAISPDGKYVVHAIQDRGNTGLLIRQLGGARDIELVPPERTILDGLVFSKDSGYVFFLKKGESIDLYKVPVTGGSAEKVAERVNSPISFSPDGSKFAFVRSLPDGTTVLIVRDKQGKEKQIARREYRLRFSEAGVSWSPDGKYLAAAVNDERERSVMDIAVLPAEGGIARLIAPANWRDIGQVAWLPDGSGLVAPAVAAVGEAYIQIWFFPADGGPARAITTERTEHWGVSVSSDGEKLLTLDWQNRSNIWKLPGGDGERAQPISRNIHANYRAISVAPDGRIVYPSNEDADGNRDLWMMNADGTGETKLTDKQGANILPCVTRDGRYIIVASNRGDLKTYHIWRMNLDGSDPKQLTFGASERGPFCPPDPSFVYFHTGTPAQGMKVSRIGRVSIEGGDQEVLTDYPSGRSDISPDGRFIASACVPEPESKPKICIIPVGGGKPEKTFDLEQLSYLRWRPDGSAVTFTKTIDGVSNFWDQPLDGGPQKQITNFGAEWIQLFQWSANGDLYCSRGYEIRDPVVITNFK